MLRENIIGIKEISVWLPCPKTRHQHEQRWSSRKHSTPFSMVGL